VYDFIADVLNNIFTFVICLADIPIRRLVTWNSCSQICAHVTFPDFLLSWALLTGQFVFRSYFHLDVLQTCDGRILMNNYTE
jgi:hypothetical protein